MVGALHGGPCGAAGGSAAQDDSLQRRQRPTVGHRGQGGAAGIGDLGFAEVEQLGRWQQPSSFNHALMIILLILTSSLISKHAAVHI